MRKLILLTLAGLTVPAAGVAQNSVYGVRGAGFPGRPLSVRARGTGGGLAMFDRMSALNPASVGALSNLRVSATYGTTFRSYDAGSASVSGLTESRFPHALVGGALGLSRFAFAASYSTYAERSYDFALTDTVSVRSAPVEVTDRLVSTGGIVDVRGALAYRVSPRMTIGGGLHVINGSARVSATRDFVDSRFRSYQELTDLSFSGVGFSAGMLTSFAGQRVILGAVARRDSRLTSTVNERSDNDTQLPMMFAGGASLRLTNRLQWATTASWRSWGGAVTQPGTTAFDTWDVASGFEVVSGLGSLPLRVGGRYGTLPFSPQSTQPHEYGLAAGSGFVFAQGRGGLDFSLERIGRSGGGATEQVWHFTIGISVQP